ncbi:MAG: hypothetical protein ACOC1P_00475 [Minisyncoccales bacterium]
MINNIASIKFLKRLSVEYRFLFICSVFFLLLLFFTLSLFIVIQKKDALVFSYSETLNDVLSIEQKIKANKTSGVDKESVDLLKSILNEYDIPSDNIVSLRKVDGGAGNKNMVNVYIEKINFKNIMHIIFQMEKFNKRFYSLEIKRNLADNNLLDFVASISR